MGGGGDLWGCASSSTREFDSGFRRSRDARPVDVLQEVDVSRDSYVESAGAGDQEDLPRRTTGTSSPPGS